MTRRLVLVMVGVLAPFLSSFWPAAATPVAGTLMSKTPIKDAPAGASGWRIRYSSVASNGVTVEITGVVFVPAGAAPKEGRDIVAWAHGTVGIAETCAPSTSPMLFENIAGLKALLEHGYIVTATDFQGLGTPGPHPYLVGVSSGRAVLDSVRAARALSPDASRRFIAWGESQGAHAVLWAGQLSHAYAPELDPIGIAAGAPPTDLVANFAKISDTSAHALLASYTTASWSRIYDIKLSTFANFFGRYLIRRLAKDCVHKDPVSALSNVVMLLLSDQVPYHLSEAWAKLMRENSPQPVHLGFPILIAQGDADHVVIPEVTRAFAVRSCHAGNALRYISVKGGDHITIAQRSAEPTLAWIDDRFANRPPMSDCDKLEDAVGTR